MRPIRPIGPTRTAQSWVPHPRTPSSSIVAAIVSLFRPARLVLAGVMTITLLVGSVRSFLTENLPIIQRMVANPTQAYDSKVDFRWDEFSRFMRFIAERTPEDATILFPTGGKTGFFIERRSLAGYFLYPRTVISADSITAVSPATHVVTADGAPSFVVPGTRSIFSSGRISDETVHPLKGERDIRLTVYGLRLLDETGAVTSSIRYSDPGAQIARRTGGRATRTTHVHEIVSGSGGGAEVFDFQFREPTDFDVWRLPIDLEARVGQHIDLELDYALRDPGVSLTLESAQSAVSAIVVEPLLADQAERPRTLRVQDVTRRLRESAEAGRGGALPSRVRFDARLLFTPGTAAVYPDTGLIDLKGSGSPG
jgi:hypothetical protein